MLTTGLHIIDEGEYHADPAPAPSLSSTLAKLILDRSPLHAWTASPRLNPAWEPVNSDVFDVGRAAHRAVLGQGGDYVAYPEEILGANGAASTKAAKEWAEHQRSLGRTPLKQDQVDAVEAMAAATRAHLATCGITLDPRRSELTAIAEIDGTFCRARIDNAPDRPVMLPGIGPRKVLIDFKSCEVATPEACRRAVESYGYDTQKQHYVETWKAATDEDRAFLFVFTEKTAPHGTCILWLLDEPGHSADWLEDARDKVRAARRTWRECLDANQWPGYPHLIVQVGASPFHRQKWQDTQSRATVARERIHPAALAGAMEWQAPERTAQ
jgi:hypothetical protein